VFLPGAAAVVLLFELFVWAVCLRGAGLSVCLRRWTFLDLDFLAFP
jgi:hypothetical protein